MSNPVLQHALENVWCVPEQDFQYIFSGYRVSQSRAEINRFRLMNREIRTPTAGVRYHIYQIGHLHPDTAGLLPPGHDWYNEVWLDFTVPINTRKTYIDLYNDQGYQLPRYKSYYMFTRDRCLLVAVERDKHFDVNLLNERVFLRVYRNAYLRTLGSDAIADSMLSVGKDIKNIDDVLAFQLQYNTLAAKPGAVAVYRDGWYIDKVDLFNFQIGHRLDMVYDSTFKRVVTFKIADLLSFESTLDRKRKYLLHYPQSDDNVIDYHDDIDIHIYYQSAEGRYQGRYYHHNTRESIRMVTHRDYSVPVDYIQRICQDIFTDLGLVGTVDYGKMYIELKIRHGGANKPLVFDHQRIFELYKLDDQDVLDAMVGTNAVVPEWTANALESSYYTKLMRADSADLNVTLAQEAYGYHSLSRLLGDSPLKVDTSGTPVVKLPPVYHETATVYEYDQFGTLLGNYHHQLSDEYYPVNAGCALVEPYVGKGSHAPKQRFGKDNIQLSTRYNYRVYMCYENGGIPDNNWKDITGSEHYHVENNYLRWNNLETGQFLMVRYDDSFLAYDMDVPIIAGTLYFTFSSMEDRNGDGNYDHHVLGVPYGEMDIFLNGHPLIQGLDYIVEFPKVYIINKKYLRLPVDTLQHIHVRMNGFCRSDLTMEPMDDFGFIEHGCLSDNDRFNLRDDRVLRITVGGKVVERDSVKFSERANQVDPLNPLNGVPYQIRDRVIPLLNFVPDDTYALRSKAKLVDKHVSDYLTLKLPEAVYGSPNAILEQYPLISPFTVHILFDLIAGNLDDQIMNKPLSVNDIDRICQPYRELLKFDPAHLNEGFDWRYIKMIPHPLSTVIDLNLYQYRFLMNAVKLYCGDRVELSGYVQFSA